MRMQSLVQALVLSIYVFLPLNAQNELNIEPIHSKQQLSHDRVFRITQTSDGLLWISTVEGLNSFDGYDISVHKASVESGASTQGIINICETKDGNLLSGTLFFGMSLFDRNTGAFYGPNTLADSGDIAYRRALDIARDTSYNNWVISGNGTLIFYNADKRRFSEVKIKNKPKNIHFQDIFIDKKNNVWLGANAARLCRLNKIDSTLKTYDLKSHHQINPGHISQIEEYGNSLFLAINGTGLVKFTGDESSKYGFKTEVICKNPNYNNYSISRFDIDNNGNLWVSKKNVIARMDRLAGGNYNITEFEFDPSGKPYISHDIMAMFIDNSGILWIGTFGGGVLKVDQKKNFEKHINIIPGFNISGVVTDIHPLGNDELILGTENMELVLFNKISKTYT